MEKIEAAFCEHAFLNELIKDHVLSMVTDIKQVGDDLSLKVKFGYPLRIGSRKLEMKLLPI